MLTLAALLVLMAMGLALWSANGKFPAWPAIFVLCFVELLQLWPR